MRIRSEALARVNAPSTPLRGFSPHKGFKGGGLACVSVIRFSSVAILRPESVVPTARSRQLSVVPYTPYRLDPIFAALNLPTSLLHLDPPPCFLDPSARLSLVFLW